jgi:hypothetical protein
MSDSLKAIQLDAVTGQVTERELTDEEKAFHQTIVEQTVANDAAAKAKELARSSALSKLAALGLTEEEIAAL